MAETYCGKTCAECAQRETLSCSGCKTGPGKLYGGDCELAKCCRSKGHQECTTCGFKGNCGTLRGKERMPEYRLKHMEAEKARAAAAAKRAPVLGKWLWILFWLIIPSTIASLMTNENIAGSIPSVFVPGQILSAVCSALYGLILVKLATEEARYLTAGVCGLICGAVNVLLACVSGGGELPPWTLLISLPATIVSLVGEYQEFEAHSVVLSGVDDDLSEKWTEFWKWYIGMYAGVFGGLLLAFIIPVLGLLVSLAAAIGLIVVGIMRLVYLYRTAKAFRDYTTYST